MSHFAAEVFFYQSQREIEPRAQTGRRPNGAVDREDTIHVDFDFWIKLLQLLREIPVGGCPSTVEQSRLCEDKRAGTEGSDA